ncbi:MAG: hypothetical protein ACREXT_02705 [Gammaproteobacteria bacterium]
MRDGAQLSILEKRRVWSTKMLGRLADSFAREGNRLAPLTSIIAVGSLGRLEAHRRSDIDCVLLQNTTCDATGLNDACATVISTIRSCGFRVPKRGGIYRQPITIERLCASTALGDLTESPAVFGKRIQLLLDARAITGEEDFRDARGRVLAWYERAGAAFSFDGRWDFLARDLLRYMHSYWNWQMFKLEATRGDSWFLRQAKLRSSRLLTWFGLWVLLSGAAERRKRGTQWLRDNLDRTPLDRTALVMGNAMPAQFDQLAVAYQFILGLLTDPHVRRALLDPAMDPVRYRAGDLPAFEQILAASRIIRTCIARFVAKQNRAPSRLLRGVDAFSQF